MKLIGRIKSSKAKKGSSAPLQSREKISANVDGVAAGSHSRQVAPDDNIPLGAAGYASSRDEVFFEACHWLESDCDDEFFSINGDGTPERSFRANSSNHTAPPEPRKLPTLGAILKSEPLRPPPPPTRLADLLRERQESFTHNDGSACRGEEASHYYCCMPSFPRAVGGSYAGRRKRR